MLKTLAVVTAFASALAISGAAFAEVLPQGPEPYTAPDPVYTPHKIVSTVTMQNDQAPSSSNTDAPPSAPAPSGSHG